MAGARGSVFYALFGRPSDRFMRGFTLPLPKACALLLLLGGFGNAVTASAADAGLSALGAGYTAQDAPLGAPTELRRSEVRRVGKECDRTGGSRRAPHHQQKK